MKRLANWMPLLLPAAMLLAVISAQAGNTQNEFVLIKDSSCGTSGITDLDWMGYCYSDDPLIDDGQYGNCKKYYGVFPSNCADQVWYASVCVSSDDSSWGYHYGLACDDIDYTWCASDHEADYYGPQEADCVRNPTYDYMKIVSDNGLAYQDYTDCAGPAIIMRYQYSPTGTRYERQYFLCEE